MNVLYPVFALVALTVCVAVRLGFMRYGAVSRREVDAEYYQAYLGEEPKTLRITSRHLVNLLELPMLFYLACVIAFITNQTGTVMLVMAWSYVGLRVIHTLVHLGSNVVLWRFRVFVLSLLVLAAIWVSLFLGLVLR